MKKFMYSAIMMIAMTMFASCGQSTTSNVEGNDSTAVDTVVVDSVVVDSVAVDSTVVLD